MTSDQRGRVRIPFTFVLLPATLVAACRVGRLAQNCDDRSVPRLNDGWSRVSAGIDRACALRHDGTAWCWDADGEVREVRGPAFVEITVGSAAPCADAAPGTRCGAGGLAAHACALDADGMAYCWGTNEHGQLGDGTTRASNAPVSVRGQIRFHSISAGAGFTCGVSRDASAYCWGFNGSGNLGTGGRDPEPHPYPRTVAFHVAAISAGTGYACALDTGGQAYCWGEDRRGRIGSDVAMLRGETDCPLPLNGAYRFAALSTGGTHVCGLTRSGEAVCWGDNTHGELGSPAEERTSRRDPRLAAGPPMVSLSAGPGDHTCGLTEDGAAWCWGRAGHGALGTDVPATTCFSGDCVPRPAPARGETRFRSISAGQAFSCGVTLDGALHCWGRSPLRDPAVTCHAVVADRIDGRLRPAATRKPAISPSATAIVHTHERWSA